MAIEFNCPYCTATIRVPDAYAGQQGRCPKCDTRLLVPDVSRPGSTTPSGASDSATQWPAAQPPAELPSSEPHPADAVPGLIVPDPPSLHSRSLVNTPRRRRRSRLPARVLMIGVPVILFLALLVAIFWSLTTGLNLRGELTARRLSGAALPAVTLPWTDLDLAADDRTELQQFLTTNPEVLSSRLVTCRLIGTEEGIEVRLTTGREGQWFVVDITGNAPLALWLKNERAKLNPLRLKALSSTLTAWAKDKLAQSRGEPIAIDAAGVRDRIGFNAGGGALSFAVAAIVGDQLIPAAAEDKDGNPVFSLPESTTSFQMKGRIAADGSPLFNGDYAVTVSGDVVSVEEPEPESDPEKTLPGDEAMEDSPSPDKMPDAAVDEPDMKAEKPAEMKSER